MVIEKGLNDRYVYRDITEINFIYKWHHEHLIVGFIFTDDNTDFWIAEFF